MYQVRFLFLLSIISLGLSSCKKDRLRWQSAQQLNSSTTHRLNRILFMNDTLGFVAGGERYEYADILTTHDGGYNWQYQTFPEVGKGLYALAGNAQGDIYATGFEGKLLHSTDHGTSWNITAQRYDTYKGMATTNEGNLLLIGGISFDYGFIQRADGAGNFKSRDSLRFEVNDISMSADGTGYVAGFGTVLKTTDNGGTWQRQTVGSDNFKGLYVVSNNEVWACGYNGCIYHTTNGGDDWERKRNGNSLALPRYHLESILFTDALNGYAVGEEGLVIYTDDGGDHWSEFDRFTSQTLHHIVRCPNGDLLVCGDGGTLYRLQKK